MEGQPMAKYHCPQCKKELKKGDYPKWVKWFIGPIFGQMLRPLICDEHGEIDLESFPPTEKSSIQTKRNIGIIFGIILNIVFIIFIIWAGFNDF